MLGSSLLMIYEQSRKIRGLPEDARSSDFEGETFLEPCFLALSERCALIYCSL